MKTKRPHPNAVCFLSKSTPKPYLALATTQPHSNISFLIPMWAAHSTLKQDSGSWDMAIVAQRLLLIKRYKNLWLERWPSSSTVSGLRALQWTKVRLPAPTWQLKNSCNQSSKIRCPLLGSVSTACTWCRNKREVKRPHVLKERKRQSYSGLCKS